MTAFGSAQVESEHGSLNMEVRSVNNRYLDLNIRLPEDLRFFETRLRELISKYAKRGKLEIKFTYSIKNTENLNPVDEQALKKISSDLEIIRKYIPDAIAPAWAEMPRLAGNSSSISAEQWLSLCESATNQALTEFQQNRRREGARLASAMLELAKECEEIVAEVEQELPGLITAHKEKISQKLAEALAEVNPEGFTHITGSELSARLAQEASLFSMKVDVEEELIRQKSHLQELREILSGERELNNKRNHSNGKRMDFLFQEMNREANTLGSKSAGLKVTQAAIDLKLLIEQLREQAQNIE